MTFTLTVDMDNAAFADGGDYAEVARILREVAKRVAQNGETDGKIRDGNGNTVGAFATK